MDDIQRFLAHAIQLEKESARRYEELAEAMQSLGSMEVAEFFRQMAHYSRLHLKEAMQRGGFHDLPTLAAEDYDWPEGSSPEAAAWAGVDGFMDVPGALALALDGEQRSRDYYRSVAETARDPEVTRMASSFAEEEAEHVAWLEAWRNGAARG
ncbi:ferritin-like domain-containing protein [Azotobacter chroococcum]|uniref:Rubrerythrin/Ferredoxin n=1 Tax=Azotobacter chroococcum NCIMB 8003 TaxID=1328314 RepID=A0A0C4WPN2_9GAMM|nr:ferritin family protein [Azotobacter chroococcum]AJE22569.1 Rubrerythrin/Ferredoxin [Azotobacter chroococcum NCIMB 8003]